MRRRYAHPNTWALPVDSPYAQALQSGNWGLTRGQLDLDLKGNLVNPRNASAQNRATAAHGLTALEELGFKPRDCVRAVVFFNHRSSQASLERQLLTFFKDVPPTIVMVPVPGFPAPGMVVESEFIASKDQSQHNVAERRGGTTMSPARRAGNFIFLGSQTAVNADGSALYPGDLESQMGWLKNRFEQLLCEFDLEPDDLVRLTTYYADTAPTATTWQQIAERRARWFKHAWPTITDIPLERLQPEGVLLSMDGIAISPSGAKPFPRQALNPGDLSKPPFDLPHPAAIHCGDHLFIGGRNALSAQGVIVKPGASEYQARHCMEEIGVLLNAADMSYDDIIKVNTYCPGRDGEIDALMSNFSIRASYYNFPGPASTGVYTSALPLPGLGITIEAIACKKD